MTIALEKALAGLPKTFAFFDLETSGLSVHYDQIIQIAAIRADNTFAEPVDGRGQFSFRARRRPHITPSPAAMLATGLRPADLETGLPQFDVVFDAAERLRSWGATVFAGFNSLRFDEPFLRHRLFENLEAPYLTQTSGSTRVDFLRVAQAVAVLAPGALRIPVNQDGMRSFALGGLVRANAIAFPEETAHEALADVKATMALARLIRARAPQVLAETLALADKAYAARVLAPGRPVLMLRMVKGVPLVLPIVPLGASPDDANAIICADLSLDSDDLIAATDEELLGVEKAWPAPIFSIRVNAQPLVWRDEPGNPHVDSLRALVDGALSPDELLRRAERIFTHANFKARAIALESIRFRSRARSPHLEERLYENFATRMDFRYGKSIHDAMPFDRAPLAAFLIDERLREHARRAMHETYPVGLDDVTRARLDRWQRERLLGPSDMPWRTVAAARLEIAELRKTATPDAAIRLNEIAAFLDKIEADARA
jgi:exodeoxyribonuclease-1